MPQPLRGRMIDGATEGTLVLQHRAQCAMMIGLIAAEWAHLEEQMAHMFAMATAEVVLNGTSVSLRTQPTAAAAMEELDSLHSRLGIIRNALDRVLPEVSDDLAALSAHVRRCAGSRNDVIHARWAISPRYPDDAIRVVGGMEYIRYTPRDFDEILSRIVIQTSEVSEFNLRCQDLRIAAARATPREQGS